jgi:hypothetical protein
LILRLLKDCVLGRAGQLVNVTVQRGSELIKLGIGYEFNSEPEYETKVITPRKRGRPKKCTTD